MKRLFFLLLIVFIFVSNFNAVGQELEIPEQVLFEGFVYDHAKGYDAYEEIRYEDIDGDAKDEAILRMKTYYDDVSWAFTLIYDKSEDGYILKKTIKGGETPKKTDIFDIDEDGVKDLILFDHSGNHYTVIMIYRFRNGDYELLLENGTPCYVYEVNTADRPVRVVIGREDWDNEEFCYGNSDKLSLKEVWVWNGDEFEYNPKLSTSPQMTEWEALDKTVVSAIEEMRAWAKEQGHNINAVMMDFTMRAWTCGRRFFGLLAKDTYHKTRKLFNRDPDDVISYKVSPDGRKVIYVKEVKECPWNSDTGWFPSDYDEIWERNLESGEEKRLVKNNYEQVSETEDWKNYLGSFDSLHFSPDGKRIYFLCQNCVTNAVLYIANVDGTNIRRIRYAHQLNMVGGNPGDEYYGYLVVGVKKQPPGTVPLEWTVILLDAEGGVVEEIKDLEQFWQKHKKL